KNFDYGSNSFDTFQKQFNDNTFDDIFNKYDPDDEETKESKEKVTSFEKEALDNKELN
ncbi:23751_t:CDS:1, partial [Gigaspora margarita]